MGKLKILGAILLLISTIFVAVYTTDVKAAEFKLATPNTPPKAYINTIVPNPAVEGQEIILIGGGTDVDGTIIAYQWRSSLDGVIGNQPAISISDLSIGVHTIYFSVQDNDYEWSTEAVATLVVEKPITEDPIYQQLGELNQTVNNLTDYTNNLNQTIDNLASKIEDLSNKLGNLTTQFMMLGTVTIILVIALIVLVYATRRKRVQ